MTVVWFDPLFSVTGTSDLFSNVSEYLDPCLARNSSEESVPLSSRSLCVWIEQRHGLRAEWCLSWLVVQTKPLGLVLQFDEVFSIGFCYILNCCSGTVCRNGSPPSCTAARCWSSATSSRLAIWGPTYVCLGSCLHQKRCNPQPFFLKGNRQAFYCPSCTRFRSQRLAWLPAVCSRSWYVLCLASPKAGGP